MAKGLFIVLEGLDGAGITTQVEYLRTSCEKQGIRVLVTKEPSDGPAGILIRSALRRRLVDPQGNPLAPETMALLFAADRQDHVSTEVLPALKTGMNVISDRYYLSSFAYQNVEVKDIEWLRKLNSKCPKPDLTIFLDVPADICLARMHSDVWRASDQLQLYEEYDALKQVRANFLKIIEILISEDHRIEVVDGTREIANVGNEIFSHVAKLLEGVRKGDSSTRRTANSSSRQIAAILKSQPAKG